MQVTENMFRLAMELRVKPILYTDVINGKQTCRDDLWLLTTEQLINLCSSHLAKPLAESAVASHEYGAGGLLSELMNCSRADPNKGRTNAGKRMTINTPIDLFERIENAVAARQVIQTEQPSLSDAEIDEQMVQFAKLHAWRLSNGQFGALREYTHQVVRALLAQRQDSDRIAELEAEVKQLRSERDAQQWYPFQDSGKDAMRRVAIYAAESMQKACFNAAPESEAKICAIHASEIIDAAIANGSVMAKDR